MQPENMFLHKVRVTTFLVLRKKVSVPTAKFYTPRLTFRRRKQADALVALGQPDDTFQPFPLVGD